MIILLKSIGIFQWTSVFSWKKLENTIICVGIMHFIDLTSCKWIFCILWYLTLVGSNNTGKWSISHHDSPHSSWLCHFDQLHGWIFCNSNVNIYFPSRAEWIVDSKKTICIPNSCFLASLFKWASEGNQFGCNWPSNPGCHPDWCCY